jgi:hypothetical protein
MRWPTDTSLRPTATGTAETRQPERDLTEHGGDLAGPVVLDLARCRAGSAFRPPGGMVPALRRDHRMLNLGQKLSAIRQAQAQIREIAQITGALDLQHVDTAVRTIGPDFYQAQNQPHPHSPAAERLGRL